jgi:hypothetical protein
MEQSTTLPLFLPNICCDLSSPRTRIRAAGGEAAVCKLDGTVEEDHAAAFAFAKETYGQPVYVAPAFVVALKATTTTTLKAKHNGTIQWFHLSAARKHSPALIYTLPFHQHP